MRFPIALGKIKCPICKGFLECYETNKEKTEAGFSCHNCWTFIELKRMTDEEIKEQGN